MSSVGGTSRDSGSAKESTGRDSESSLGGNDRNSGSLGRRSGNPRNAEIGDSTMKLQRCMVRLAPN